MTLPAFTYCVDARGSIFLGAGKPREADSPTKSAQVFVDGVQRPQGWLTHFGHAERDLLRVTAAILDLDRLSRRRPHDARAERRELGWRRAISVEIAVEDPSRWQAVQSELGALLAFLSDDFWSLTFVPAGRFHEQCVLIAPEINPNDEIALFSGGLDSSVGLRARHLQRGGAFVTISAVGNEVRRRAQRDALQALRDLGVEITPISIDHQLQDNARARRSLEVTQRTRGLFFLAMGAAVCSQVRNPVFNIYETGVGCLNIPTSAAQVASQGTRAMHPLTVALFNALAAKVLDHPARAVLPFFFLTKGELCKLVDADLDPLARTSSSCDEGDGHKADLSRIETFEDLTDLDPNVRHVFKAALGMDLAADVARSQTIEMYRRYAAEIDRFLVAARPTLHARTPRPAKEVVHDLFSAAR